MAKARFTSEEMLARLVGFDTTSSKSNLGLIHWVQEYLRDHGVDSTLIHDATKTKANLHAVIGPQDKPGIVLSGHTDVVPVEGQAWESDPFSLREHDGLLYGRGAADMKGFLAVALARLPEMTGGALKAPVHFALSYDEEVGCFGAHDLADHIVAAAVRPKLCVVGEPTMMKLITGHKGYCRYDCLVRGREAHSSLAPYAVNAVEYAAEMVAHIRAVARRQASEGPFNTQFDPPFTTLHTCVIRGGTAVNIVPPLCEFSFEIRNIPETDSDALAEEIRQHAFRVFEPHMKDIDPTAGFEFRKMETVPAFDIANDEAAVDLARALSGCNAAEKVSFVTEAGIFQNKGVPTVVCGPGSIEQAHKPNEFVAQDQLTQCGAFLDRLIGHLRA